MQKWWGLFVGLISGVAAAQSSGESDDLMELTLEDLLQVKIITASNIEESLAEAPATMIVLSKAEILARGYDNLTEVFDDLPGMEMIRPFGFRK